MTGTGRGLWSGPVRPSHPLFQPPLGVTVPVTLRASGSLFPSLQPTHPPLHLALSLTNCTATLTPLRCRWAWNLPKHSLHCTHCASLVRSPSSNLPSQTLFTSCAPRQGTLVISYPISTIPAHTDQICSTLPLLYPKPTSILLQCNCCTSLFHPQSLVALSSHLSVILPRFPRCRLVRACCNRPCPLHFSVDASVTCPLTLPSLPQQVPVAF
ncbi:uncharacterized protein PV06_09622 [Exophiala oligosperma]|uniref:Uncharacterized protein n=1 Tax=Exophiala oligosperma TaxID=215243 RepID=A0A0D2AES3_9EURO|nr:uncharacterized protein PV06_09622 [Exophiala oligosperma]KIW38671.1 hypothetical protein PV06_09622 [Exophiala oligosperma]